MKSSRTGRLCSSIAKGKGRCVLETLIEKATDCLNLLTLFEQAATFRDQIKTIRRVQEQQYVSDDLCGRYMDVFRLFCSK
ncbi:hypothetical protein OH492_08415 [Vibrio chagasii]|nr:hypothetical protein [Vibrio chagasii]